MNELMLAFLVWIGHHSTYNTNLDLPNIVITNQHNMCAMYGIDQKTRCESMRLRGFFNKKLSIYLPQDFDVNNAHHQSQLLHELIHYVQFKNMDDDKYCLGLIELEAYDLQDKWRDQKGMKPVLADFNRLMLEASCNA